MLYTLLVFSCLSVTLRSDHLLFGWSCLFVTLSSIFVRSMLLGWCVIGLVAFYIPLCFGAFRACPPLLRCRCATAFLKGPGHFYGSCYLSPVLVYLMCRYGL